jgi:hydrogenase maturation protease
MSAPRVLVAGIGNIFFGDDAFGVEVANRLGRCCPPAGVEVREYGIRGVHLAYELLDGYDALVLVDALPMGEPAGTVAVLEVDPSEFAATGEPGDGPPMDAHTMSPAVVLRTLSSLGGRIGRVLVVGCQPGTIDEGIGLSEPVAGAVDEAIALLGGVIDDLLAELRTRQEETCP